MTPKPIETLMIVHTDTNKHMTIPEIQALIEPAIEAERQRPHNPLVYFDIDALRAEIARRAAIAEESSEAQ